MAGKVRFWEQGQDPPAVIGKKDKQPEWATLIPRRDPEFKMHTSLGLAKTALSGLADYKGRFHDRGALYRWNGSVWELYVWITNGDYRNDFELWTNVEKFKRQEAAFVIEETPS